MLKQIFDLFKEQKDLNKLIKKDIQKLRKLKAMIEIEKKNTRKTTIENEIIKLKEKYIEDMKKKDIKEMIEIVDDKKYKLKIENTKNIWGKEFEYLDIQKIKD